MVSTTETAPPLVTSGCFVRARSKAWIVDRARFLGTTAVLDLLSIEDDSQGESLEITLAPEIGVEVLDPQDWSPLLRASFEGPDRLGAFLRAAQWRSATAADRRLFQSPFRAGIRLEAYQLLPLAKALDLPRVNLLIADDVGLGKTVEAGLIMRELLLRRRIEMIVVAAPASMLLQWHDELSQKFGLDFTIVDREHLLDTRRMRGFAANPWSIGSRFLVSHSVLADDVYMGGLRDLLGEFRQRSLLILDEAHHAAPSAGAAWATESQMTRSVRALAGRFEHRLFLSATPHNGHSNSFATLLEILDPQRFHRGIPVASKDLEPIMVRRLKEDLRELGQPFARRVVEPIVIAGLPSDAPELRLAAMLDDYRTTASGGSQARFLFAHLQQRLFSSICAFDRTLSTHRRTLIRKSGADAARDTAELVDDDDLIDAVTEKARGQIGDLEAALARVDAMLAISRQARDLPDARIERLLDWIESEMLGTTDWQGRRLILFTEWDDTRRWLVERLKEGLSRRRPAVDLDGRIRAFTGQTNLEERDRIKIAFNAPFEKEPVRILVCTDAAREGLNLQARCHDLVHFDLPWNPSRLEQRNGRIDRKLQPSSVVTCRYFVYAQREEDRVLEALVRKTEVIRQELGASGEVLRLKLERTLTHGGIRRGEADKLAASITNEASPRATTAERELGDERAKRMLRLKEEEERLRRGLAHAKTRVGVAAEDVRHVVEVALRADGTALAPGHFSVPQAMLLDPDDKAFVKDPSWQVLFDELRPGRPAGPKERRHWRDTTPVRGLVFEPPLLAEGEPEPQDIVQLHLEHRLVKRLLSRFASQGFRSSVGRITAIVGSGAQPRVVLIGRLSLFGPGARRLHEEIIPVTAAWRDMRRETPLAPFAQTGEAATIGQLDEALRKGVAPGSGIITRLQATVERDIEDLRPHLEARAVTAEADAVKDLTDNGHREAEALQSLLARQIARVREAMREKPEPLQFALDLRSDEQKRQAEKEQRQYEADRASWGGKLERLGRDLEQEPALVRAGYEVKARQLEPLALVYLWPATN